MTNATPSAATGSLAGNRARRTRERRIGGRVLAAALVSVAITGFIIFTVLEEAISFLSQIKLEQLFTAGWFPRRGPFDIPTLLIGTCLVTAIAMLIAAPVGLLSAVYLAEYASPRVRNGVKPVLEVLAGVPSVVLGFFALTIINPYVIQA